MKRIFLTSALVAAMGVMFTGCLKDKGFDNGTYGINDPDDQPKGVGFPESAKANNPFAVNSLATPQTISAPFVNLLTGERAPQDVHVTLQLDPAIVSAYNAATGSSFQIPTASQYNISSLVVTIPAGERFAILPIVIPNASALSLTTTYALGFRIASVDGGYQIAGNMDEVLISWSVKNQYDGIYSYVSGLVTRYTAPGVPAGDALSGPLGPQNPDIIMATSGPNSVDIPIAGQAGTFTWSGGNSGVAGIDGVRITVDPATNLTTATSSGYATSNPTFGNWPGKVNRYIPATRTFELAFRWNPASTTREYEVVLEYDRPR